MTEVQQIGLRTAPTVVLVIVSGCIGLSCAHKGTKADHVAGTPEGQVATEEGRQDGDMVRLDIRRHVAVYYRTPDGTIESTAFAGGDTACEVLQTCGFPERVSRMPYMSKYDLWVWHYGDAQQRKASLIGFDHHRRIVNIKTIDGLFVEEVGR
jgi:hypothetical protein